MQSTDNNLRMLARFDRVFRDIDDPCMTAPRHYNGVVPLKDEKEIVHGVISVGYDLAQSGPMDAVKKLFGTEVTLFGGDVRYATTIERNGARYGEARPVCCEAGSRTKRDLQ